MTESVEMLTKCLRERFARIFVSDPQLPYTYSPANELDRRLKNEAAILVLFEKRSDDWYTFFTVRAAGLRLFGGEASFPGGHRERQDKSPVETALRECEEETGLQSSSVHVVGTLKPLISAQQCLIHPVVGLLKQEFTPKPNPSEVQRCFWTSTRKFLETEGHLKSFPVSGIKMHAFKIDKEIVSGLTANLITSLSMLLHQRHTEFQFGNDKTNIAVEDHVHKHFCECYNLIEMFKEESEKTLNRL
ncbi:Peroxisomal coenzyme A diphosphatase NUDT7 isoform X2 [Aphelenchoides bicaudatus]|nr:Peroxisomal coenzyme A diphosphatase NUDT7 isoform X2 [Aphelenchoides bicaudatus]